MRGITWADPEGVGEAGGPDPGKSQVIWVSVGNKRLDPPPPPSGKSWTPGKWSTPTGTLEYDSFH